MTAQPVPAQPQTSPPPVAAGETRVWDLGVRGFHWLTVASFLVASATALTDPTRFFLVHVLSGTFVLVFVAFRAIWGFTGSSYARFSSFWFTPAQIVDRLRETLAGRERRYVGHNPLGATMIYALLAALVATVATGYVAMGGFLKAGPFKALVTFDTAALARGAHSLFAYGAMFLVGFHLAGVALEVLRHREPLVRAMVTGRKTSAPNARPARPAKARPALAAVLFAVLLGGASWATAALSALPAYGVPPPATDKIYVDECGACHFAMPPSIASTKTWDAILSGLGHHFGEDASVDPSHVAHLKAYLDANSADHFDTLAAHALSRTDPSDPLRPTSSRFWRFRHDGLPKSVFDAKAVGGRTSCNACHKDAVDGIFSPFAIDIPEGAFQ
ncbi:MAG: cytochrome b/b6 domain-containing protein [Hyphomicrobiales bacterium]|nr:cytochrome b/b6 domain-containing protein [Hyphomicrobiales bacterium]MDE2016775.1 cytochrome b/b6 domain-containing protein [Hyphomicrobiales bacterium]